MNIEILKYDDIMKLILKLTFLMIIHPPAKVDRLVHDNPCSSLPTPREGRAIDEPCLLLISSLRSSTLQSFG